jgi:hypothetical protein
MPVVEFPQFQPMCLARTREAFDHADFVFELKYDGFRALAYMDGGSCRLVSRRNHVYKSYAPLCHWIGKHLGADNAVLDGELACLDEEGRPKFNRLLRHRGEPAFVAFDLLWLNGRDLRRRTLLDRKTALRTLIRNGGRILYADHIDGKGAELYQAACHSDLEGIVAKYKWGAYCPDPGSSSWNQDQEPGVLPGGQPARAVHPLPPGSLCERYPFREPDFADPPPASGRRAHRARGDHRLTKRRGSGGKGQNEIGSEASISPSSRLRVE